MFYRMTRIHFEDDNFDDLLTWAETARARIEALDGFLFADIVVTGPGEGMVVAAYDSEGSFQAASTAVAGVVGEMAQLLTSEPHTHQGTVAYSYGR